MTSQIFKLMAVLLTAVPSSVTAQTASDSIAEDTSMVKEKVTNRSEMERMIDRSISKIKGNSPETIITCISEMERIAAIYPDSVAPKHHIAMLCLSHAVQRPQTGQARNMIEKAQETIAAMEKMKAADISDVCTLRGFLYTAIIVQDPMTNGPRYYRDVMENYEKALKINPANKTAQELYAKFNEGMSQMR